MSNQRYDVFVSYSGKDRDWVHQVLLARLEQTGLRVFIDFRDFEPGAPSVSEMERGIDICRKTLLVLTPEYLASEYCEIENLMASTHGPANRARRMVPLLRQKCRMPRRLSTLTYIDFASGKNKELAWSRLHQALRDSNADGESNDDPRPATVGATSRGGFFKRHANATVAALLVVILGTWMLISGTQGTASQVPNLMSPQRALIESKIRDALNLSSNAVVTATDMARVAELNLIGVPVNDDGIEWLSDPARGMTALTTLFLDGTQITNKAVVRLTSPECGLTALMRLDLANTAIDDEGVLLLASPQSSLQSLIELWLNHNKRVTDRGAKAFAATETGLRGQHCVLHLRGSGVSAECVASIQRPHPDWSITH